LKSGPSEYEASLKLNGAPHWVKVVEKILGLSTAVSRRPRKHSVFLQLWKHCDLRKKIWIQRQF